MLYHNVGTLTILKSIGQKWFLSLFYIKVTIPKFIFPCCCIKNKLFISQIIRKLRTDAQISSIFSYWPKYGVRKRISKKSCKQLNNSDFY